MEAEDAEKKGIELLTDLARQQTELGATRTYMNSERTLSVWIRTALAAMVLGIAIDRLGLWIHEIPSNVTLKAQNPDLMTEAIGIALVAYSILTVVLCSWRFILYCNAFKKKYTMPPFHKIWLPIFLALLVVLFGIGLLFVIFLIR